MDQVGKQISRSILRCEKVIRLQLRPPELGVLKVEMDIKDNILKLWMITENSSVKELLLSNAHELREALVGQGVKLDRLDIQINYNFDHSLANSKEGLKHGQGHGINGDPFTAEDDTDDGLSGPWDGLTDDHLLDLVA
jgi:flagellar hook-length control protein FliK